MSGNVWQSLAISGYQVCNLTCFWSDLWGQLWPLTSLGRSDWIFSNIIPNHPQVCNLKSFWHIFEVTSKVNFGSDLFWMVRLNILKYHPKPSTSMQFEVILTCFWSDLQGQLWPLTSLGRSDWIFSNIIPNQPQVCNLMSFWHVFEVTSEVNFGLWPH